MFNSAIKSAFAVFLLGLSSSVSASLILGSGSGALIGSDLTDPENDGSATNYVNYNATFRASHENYFGAEGAFNVFDNTVGAGNAKWCCDGPRSASVWVEADFGTTRYTLDSFTVASGNDVPGRDADIWGIFGSNDGVNYTSIFSYNNDGTSVWGNARHQVIQFSSAMNDFAIQNTGFSIFRYEAFSTVAGGAHQINEIEFFGTEVQAVSSPSHLALFGLALLGLGARRFKR